tara:strand:+ start:407 stop:856 length:450 start_codon:yes stop_codon:yes gene_type:complete
MTEPNVLGGDVFGLKFIFDSGNTRIVNLCRPYDAGNWSNANPLSLSIMNSGLSGVQYVVPVGKVFYLLHMLINQEGTTDLNLSIQRNSTVDNSVLGDNLWQMIIEGDTATPPSEFMGGLQFNAGDYVTPYLLSGTPRWACQCFGVECDV